MINVLVVEDEELIQKNIKKAIELTHQSFKVMGTAYNGVEAIELLKKQMPDVVITDIRMPLKDGIELIKYMKEFHPHVTTVILSGYEEFKYAQAALQLGVFDYLLKPIYLPDLKLLLDKLLEHCLMKKAREIESLFDSILQNREEPRLDLLALSSNYSFVPILVCAGSYISNPLIELHPAKPFWEHIRPHSIIEQMAIPDVQLSIHNGETDANKTFIFYWRNNASHSVVQFAESLYKAIREIAIYPVPITLLADSVLNDAMELSLKMKMLRAVLYREIHIGVSRIIYLADQKNVKDYKEIDAFQARRITLACEQNNADKFKAELQFFVRGWEASSIPQYLIEKQLKQIVSICQKVFPSASGYLFSNFELDILTAVCNATNFEELYRYLSRVFEAMFMMNALPELSSNLVSSISAYIQGHFMESISNQMLEEKFGYSAYYLSKLFSNELGMSPVKYMLHLRMEKAKELLIIQPKLLSKDISFMLGYDDPLYFSKIFKKETGLWPSEYQG